MTYDQKMMWTKILFVVTLCIAFIGGFLLNTAFGLLGIIFGAMFGIAMGKVFQLVSEHVILKESP